MYIKAQMDKGVNKKIRLETQSFDSRIQRGSMSLSYTRQYSYTFM